MSDFRKPDLSAPRFRYKTKKALTKDVFDLFLEKHPQYKGMTLGKFKEVVSTFHEELCEGVMNNREGIELPENLGYLLIARCDRTPRENVNYAASIKEGKKIMHKNWDSDDYLAKICYSNYSLKYRFADRELWAFAPVRQFKTKVSNTFSEKYEDYMYLDKDMTLSKLYEKVKK